MLVLLLAGCPVPGTPPPAGCTDQDRDGVCVDADCDDADPASHPGATEIWYDEIDQACDGGDDFDADGDGWPIGEVSYTWNTFSYPDCDDQDPAAHPGAAPICGNGVDDDCDLRDECSRRGVFDLVDVATGGGVNGAEPEDAADLDGDGVPEWVVVADIGVWAVQPSTEAPVTVDGGVPLSLGRIWTFAPLGGIDGEDLVVDRDFNGVLVYLDPELGGPPDAELYEAAGLGGLGAGDVFGDAVPALVLGDLRGPTGSTVHVYEGPFSGALALDGDRFRLTWPAGQDIGSTFVGQQVAAGNDVTGDGVADLVADVGDTTFDGGGWLTVQPGPLPAGERHPEDGVQVGSEGDRISMYQLLLDSGQDWNQDGHPDLTAEEEGNTVMWFGPFLEDRPIGDWDARIGGAWLEPTYNTVYWAGWPAPCGDLNGDTFPDVYLGYPFMVDSYVAAFLYGPFVGQNDDWLPNDLEFVSDQRLTRIRPVGDADGDGADDVLIGVYTDAGSVWSAFVPGDPHFGF